MLLGPWIEAWPHLTSDASPMRYMLDTNICIYAMRNENRNLDRRLEECQTGDLLMSTITLAELETGFAKSADPAKARQAAQAVLEAITVVPFDAAAARAFGRIQAVAPSKRGAYDRQIAAHAISLDLVLVTNDETDFVGIPGLTVENWTKSKAKSGDPN